jgi:SAM-dependent methyltransferase
MTTTQIRGGCASGAGGSTIDNYAATHPQLAERASIGPLLARAVAHATARGGLIVDVGCGEGMTLGTIAATADQAGIVGFDLSLLRARIARHRGQVVGVADGLDLPLRSGSATLVISRHVIEHIHDDRAALGELRRTLRRDGLLYLETPLRLRGAWYPYRNASGRPVLDPTHVREYESVDQVARLLTGAGFRLVEHDVVPIRFPVGHLIHRLVRPSRHATGRLTHRLMQHTGAVPVPRYRELQILASYA